MKPSRFLLLGFIVFFIACTFFGQATSSPHGAISTLTHRSPTKQRISTSTALPTSTPYPSVTASPSPSPTPTPTSFPTTPLPSPTLSSSLSSLRIAFTYDKQLWLWNKGTMRPLTNLEGYARVNFSDDGNLIAFARDGELWIINSDGSNERVLASADDFKSMEPRDPGVGLSQFDWIPGTHTLMFNTILLADYGLTYTNDLYMANADTLQWKMLRQPGEAGRFIFSPDGKRVVMVTPSKISLMKVDGSDYRTVLGYTVPYPSEAAYYAKPVWESDSQSLTVAIPPEDFYYGTKSSTNIWRLPVDGTPPEIISQLPVGDSGDDPRIWSPDKEHYAIQTGDRYYLGSNGEILEPLTEPSFIFGWFSWIDESHFLYIGPCDLRLGTIGAPSILIVDLSTTEDCISSYDFVE